MLELLEKIDILKSTFNKNKAICKLKKCQEDILADKPLYNKVKNKDQSVMKEKTIQEYRLAENEVNFLILEINQYLKQNFEKKTGCHHENN